MSASVDAAAELAAEFEILSELGRGGSAVVYLAEERASGRRVAIKLVQPSYLGDPDTLGRFAQEARTAELLQHPHIVGLHAVKRLRSGAIALVMEYVPGGTLKDLIRQHGLLPVEMAERVLRDVARGLAYAHRRGIVHRDVKPENIFVDSSSGRALLADFGIARTTDGAQGPTLQGIAIGTPAYMAPEQIDGTPVDGRADLYALALVGWEMLTGRVPWQEDSLYGVLYKQKFELLPPLRPLRPDVPPRVAATIERAAAKAPAERFPNAGAFLDSLDSASLPGPWSRWLASWRLRRLRRAAPPPPARLGAAPTQAGPGTAAADPTILFRRDAPPIAAHPDGATDGPTPTGERKGRVRTWAVVLGGALLVLGAGWATQMAALSGTTPPAAFPSLPTPVASPPGTLRAVATGDRHTCALLADGRAVCWGDNADGQLGDGTTDSRNTPQDVAGSLRFTALAAGSTHTCGLTADGTVYCWGGNGSGQLGDGSGEARSEPAPVARAHRFLSIAAGSARTCGVTTGGELDCWGQVIGPAPQAPEGGGQGAR